MKTIKQIADELGFSKDKIKYQVGKLPGEMVVKNRGITYLTDEGIRIITDILVGKNTGELPGELPGKFPSEKNDPIITLLEKNLDILQEQLKEKDKQLDKKDKQIEELNNRLAESMSIIGNEQLLHGGTIQQNLIHSDDNIKSPISSDKWANIEDFNNPIKPDSNNQIDEIPTTGIPFFVKKFLQRKNKNEKINR